MPGRTGPCLTNLTLLLVSGLMGIGLTEGALRALLPSARGYYALMPGTNRSFDVPPGLLPGVAGRVRYRVNRYGIRGRLFGPDGAEYRILAGGGSTTECLVLDDTLAWPYLLEAGLDRTADGRRAWVGNVGRSGKTARDHVVQIKHLLTWYPRIDAVIVLVGANDLVKTLQQGFDYGAPRPITEPAAEAEQLQSAFVSLPGTLQGAGGSSARPWFRETAVWQLARRAKLVWQHRSRWGAGDGGIARVRRVRAQVDHPIDSLPPLDAPLAEYRANLEAIIAVARAAGVRLVFMTQPTLWHEHLSPALERLLWFGWVGTREPDSTTAFFTTSALARGMSRYNATLLSVCADAGGECIDVAGFLPPDTTVFYDDMHFNEAGSRQLAELLQDHFARRPPFARLGFGNEEWQ